MNRISAPGDRGGRKFWSFWFGRDAGFMSFLGLWSSVRLRCPRDGEDGRVFAAGADEKAEALPVEGGAVDVPERG